MSNEYNFHFGFYKTEGKYRHLIKRYDETFLTATNELMHYKDVIAVPSTPSLMENLNVGWDTSFFLKRNELGDRICIYKYNPAFSTLRDDYTETCKQYIGELPYLPSLVTYDPENTWIICQNDNLDKIFEVETTFPYPKYKDNSLTAIITLIMEYSEPHERLIAVPTQSSIKKYKELFENHEIKPSTLLEPRIDGHHMYRNIAINFSADRFMALDEGNGPLLIASVIPMYKGYGSERALEIIEAESFIIFPFMKDMTFNLYEEKAVIEHWTREFNTFLKTVDEQIEKERERERAE